MFFLCNKIKSIIVVYEQEMFAVRSGLLVRGGLTTLIATFGTKRRNRMLVDVHGPSRLVEMNGIYQSIVIQQKLLRFTIICN